MEMSKWQNVNINICEGGWIFCKRLQFYVEIVIRMFMRQKYGPGGWDKLVYLISALEEVETGIEQNRVRNENDKGKQLLEVLESQSNWEWFRFTPNWPTVPGCPGIWNVSVH